MSAFLVLTAVYALALAGRILYDILKERGRVNPQNLVVFGVVFVDMCVLWATWFTLCEQDPSNAGLPQVIRRLGFGLTLVGGLLFALGLGRLKKLENTTQLVTGGIFQLMRHPIYTGFACWFIGWPLYWDREWSLSLGVLSLGAVIWWRHSEERALVIQFGDAYREYRKRTWF